MIRGGGMEGHMMEVGHDERKGHGGRWDMIV